MIDLKKLREEMEQDKKKDSTWGATPSVVLELLDQLEAAQKDAARYQWLRSCDLETIGQGGVFAGMTPQNVILNEEDLDEAIDAAMSSQS